MYTQIAYRCSYCKKYGLSKSHIQKHEKSCFGNPETKSCSTCANFYKPWFYNKEGFPSCLVKGEFQGIDEVRVKLFSNCDSWVERPEEEEELVNYQFDTIKKYPQFAPVRERITPFVDQAKIDISRIAEYIENDPNIPF